MCGRLPSSGLSRPRTAARSSSPTNSGLPPLRSRDLPAQLDRRLLPQPPGDDLGDALRGQLGQHQERWRSAAPGSSSRAASSPGSPLRRDSLDQHRQIGCSGAEVGEEAQRGGVGPLDVVDAEDQRPPLAEVRAEPSEAVRSWNSSIGAGRRPRRRSNRGRDSAAAPSNSSRRGALDPRAEQRQDQRRRRTPARPPSRARSPPSPSVPGAVGEQPQQGRLADPRRPLDHAYAAVALGDRPQRVGAGPPLLDPLEEGG